MTHYTLLQDLYNDNDGDLISLIDDGGAGTNLLTYLWQYDIGPIEYRAASLQAVPIYPVFVDVERYKGALIVALTEVKRYLMEIRPSIAAPKAVKVTEHTYGERVTTDDAYTDTSTTGVYSSDTDDSTYFTQSATTSYDVEPRRGSHTDIPEHEDTFDAGERKRTEEEHVDTVKELFPDKLSEAEAHQRVYTALITSITRALRTAINTARGWVNFGV